MTRFENESETIVRATRALFASENNALAGKLDLYWEARRLYRSLVLETEQRSMDPDYYQDIHYAKERYSAAFKAIKDDSAVVERL